jgi:HK97 family phage prohead protease
MTEPWTAGPQRRAGMADLAGSNGRIVRYMLSDSAVARDGHRIATSGWVLDNYLRNPIVLWAHDAEEPPIGRMVEIGAVGDRLMGSVEYADAETYPFADTIYRLVQGNFLNAVSVGWVPIEWKYSTDRGRQGGIDFSRVELLEVSQVPVPALPTALIAARAAGIDTGPLYQWAEKVLDQGGKVLVPREELEALRRAAKMPTPKPAENAAPEAGIPAVTEETDLPAQARLVRALTEHGWPAVVVDQVVGLDPWLETDSNTILGILGPIVERALVAVKAPPEPAAPPVVQIGTEAARIVAEALQRAGRVLSAENEMTLRQALDMHSNACAMIRGVCDRAIPIEPPPEDPLEDGLARAKAAVVRWREVAA